MQDFYVYILKCSDGSYYTGHTDQLEKRIAEHNIKQFDGYTAARLPFEVVFVQPFATRNEAFNVERQIKGWSRKKKEALINGNWTKLTQLSNE
jgi:predicted GIY-YIG superfamily endonuclease